MDPLSIVVSATSLAFASIKVTRALYNLRERYKSSGAMISAICSECRVLHIALSELQKLALTNTFFDRLESQPDLKDSFDLALLSCTKTFSALEGEIQELSPKSDQGDDHFLNLKYLWNEERMKEILLQLRSQQNSISVLLTAIQVDRISEIHQLLLSINIIVQQLAERSDGLHSSHRKPEDDAQSTFSFSESHRSDAKFSFDGELRSSEVYRRVSSANRRAREAGKVPDTFANGDLIDLGIDANIDAPVDQPYLDELRRHMVTLALPSATAIDWPIAEDDSSKHDAVTDDVENENRPDLADSSAPEEEIDVTEQLVNGVRLLEYRKTRAGDRLPAINGQRFPDELPAGWVLRTDPRGKAYYIDHFERYLFYLPPVVINNEDVHRALPPGWKRVETDYGRVRWVHDATRFVSHKHPYDNMKLFGYDFLNDWPFGRHGERRGNMRVYPRAFDFVGDTDAACQMSTDALINSTQLC